MMRLRMGKFCGKAVAPMGNSETIRPLRRNLRRQFPVFRRIDDIDAASEDGDGGCLRAASAALCAAVSMPRAIPETIVTPARARSPESRSAAATP